MRYALFKQKKKRVSGAKRRKSSRLRRFLLTIFLGCFALGVLSLGGVFWYFARDLPEAGALRAQAVAQSTKIYDRTGKHLLYEIHGEEKRTVIPFEQIPSVVKYATIALEDQAFYDHPGVNVKSIFRAALSQLFPGFFPRRSGGSTITQQLIKNTLLTPERTLKRKIREVILSLELERKFSKDEILEMYLNEIPYGSNAYGIESAAKTFFDKSAKDLTLDEAALLAALPQQPSRYSPYGKNTDKLIARKNYALTQMAKLGYITAEQAERAKKIDTLAKTAPKRDKIRAPHFVMYIRQQLESRYERGDIEKGGLKVITTLDWELQQLAEKAVAEGVEKNRRWRATNASLVAIDPKTGEILAMVGSADYFNREIDGNVNVALAPRQPGSSFKPYVYLGALIKGYSPETVLMDVPTRFDTGDDPYEPRNYDGTFRGPVKMKKALGMSLNIPAVKLLYLVGVKNTIALAKDLGITGLDNPDRYGLSLVLGGGEVKLLDHTAAYATLANGGVRQKPVSILRITD
ncbi:MAG TPA: penicillin-binding protein, partial [Candidatus Moranbacteria bacterium]|nr:penicillin-binding protein [Candidatus Moranbacteria bacterium]